ncbi:MAG: hypothetical protein ACE5RR_06985, partial [Nitrosarchaeum sp.]
FMIGLTPFTGLFAAALIVIAMYFGIKFYVITKNKSIKKEIPEGICAECGSKISDQKCPNCDFLND